MRGHLERRWPAVLLAGSGGAADALCRFLALADDGGGGGGESDELVDECRAICALAVGHRHLVTVAHPSEGDVDQAVRLAAARWSVEATAADLHLESTTPAFA